MIKQVKDSISVITTNANKRKIEEAKLEQEKQAIEQKKQQIQELEKKLEAKRKKLSEKKDELDKHKKFNEFLEAVVYDKNDDNREFEDIEKLQDRFKNLRRENEALMRRVSLHTSSLYPFRNNESARKWKKQGFMRRTSLTHSKILYMKCREKCSRYNLN